MKMVTFLTQVVVPDEVSKNAMLMQTWNNELVRALPHLPDGSEPKLSFKHYLISEEIGGTVHVTVLLGEVR